MVLIGAYWIYALIVLACAGRLTRMAVEWWPAGGRGAREGGLTIVDDLFLGWILITTVVSAVSLFAPVSPAVHLVVSLASLLLGGLLLLRRGGKLDPSVWKENWLLIAVAGVCVVSGVSGAVGRVLHYDTGLYHVQMVRWTNEYGVVPGLANLHGRLGFNSAADVFASYLDHFWFDGRSVRVAGLVPYALLLLLCLQGFARLRRGDRSAGTLLRCFGVFMIAADYRTHITALSTDWPANVLIFYALVLAVEVLEGRRRVESTGGAGPADGVRFEPQVIVLTLVCAFALTVKLSTAPLLALLPLVWFRYLKVRAGWRAAAIGLGYCVLVVAPYLARNVVLTGHLAYPVPGLDFFEFDWEVPAADVNMMVEIIRGWAINPVDDWYRVSEMDLSEKVRTWYRWRSGEMKPLLPWLFLGLASWVGLAALHWRDRKILLPATLGGVLGAGLAFCFLNAPEPRYAVGWLVAFSVFPTAWLIASAASRFSWSREALARGGYVLLIGIALWLAKESGVKSQAVEVSRGDWDELFSVADIPSTPLEVRKTEHGVEVRVPLQDGRAWDAPLPSTPDHALNPWLERRGAALEEGFRVTKPGYGLHGMFRGRTAAVVKGQENE